MPNLVVYVPADVARALEVIGVSQDLQRKACKEVLVGLASGEVSRAGVPVLTVPPQPAAVSPVASPPLSEGEVTRTMSGRSTSAGSFKPDFKGGKK